jgi:hypothetical protein
VEEGFLGCADALSTTVRSNGNVRIERDRAKRFIQMGS